MDSPRPARGPNGEGLAAARRMLRDDQEAAAIRAGADGGTRPASQLDATLSALEWRREFQQGRDDASVRRGAFTFDRRTEEQRIALAEELIRRVEPGPFEDPIYMALLAYQAASVEMVMPRLGPREDSEWPTFLLGTVASHDVNAFAEVIRSSGHTIVHVHSALVDFVYQAAKAVVEATDPRRSPDSSAAFRGSQLDVVRHRLLHDQAPVHRVYSTLEAHFLEGYPRAFANEDVADEHAPALSALVAMAERFIIAHEYGHGHAASRQWQSPQVANPRWAEEYFADQQAAVAVVLSGGALDGFSPEVSLAGGVFCLACLDVLRRSDGLLRTGHEPPDSGTPSHPPCRDRADQVALRVHQWFDISSSDGIRMTARLAPKHHPPDVDDALRTRVRDGAFFYAQVLLTIWKHVRERLARDYERGRALHSSRRW